MNLELSSPVVEVAGLFLTVFAAIWSLAWWLSGQFSNLRGLIFSTAEKTSLSILSKLEYHEKHDDTRFNNVSDQISSVKNDIWEMKIRNAAVRGVITNAKGQITPVVKELQNHFKDEDA